MIRGVPYSQAKSRGNKSAAANWSTSIIEQTSNFPKVKEACALKVTFLLPPNKFPTDFPYGPDLDNLLKRLLDGLHKTIFFSNRWWRFVRHLAACNEDQGEI
jgi:Holliday junction resolvase RusA-like endonuclease